MQNSKIDFKVSVIICTKNRSEHLKRCVESISLSYDNYPYKEIIIVDNGSDEKNREVNKKIALEFKARYVFEERRGLSAARNRGINEAKGDIIVFADDDFIVDKKWIKSMIIEYCDEEVMCCTGRMLSYRQDQVSDVFEKALSFDRGDKRRVFSKTDINIFNLLKPIVMIGRKRLGDMTPVPWAIGYGFCSFRKKVFEKVGYFDLDLGAGTPALGGEDVDIFYRIIKGGYKIVYQPKANILHNHRQTFEEAFKKAYEAGFASRSFFRKYYLKDYYIFLCFVGDIFLLIFSYLKAILCTEKREYRKLIEEELKGLLQVKVI